MQINLETKCTQNLETITYKAMTVGMEGGSFGAILEQTPFLCPWF